MSGAIVAQAINESIGTAGFQGLDAILKEYLGLIAEQAGTARVPISRTINGHSLASDVDLDNNDVGAAPDGFGLGGQAVEPPNNSLNNAINFGLYICGPSYAGAPTGHNYIGYGTVLVRNGSGYIIQEYCSEGSDAATGSPLKLIRKYNKDRQTWDEWEWVNPPMKVGVEYRTTERWMGKPVYAVAVDLGTMPNNELKDVYFNQNIPCKNVISYEAVITSSDYGARVLPDYNEERELRCFAVLLNSCVRIKSYHNLSEYTGKMTIKFTKE